MLASQSKIQDKERTMTHSDDSKNFYDIAIIGLNGRFPGANNIETFWKNLCNGVESITPYSDEELEAAGVDSALLEHPNYVKAGAHLTDIDLFDGDFFGYYRREAEILNPQHRLFLQCAHEVLEKVGYAQRTEHYPGRIGVYAGAGSNGYLSSFHDAHGAGLDGFQVQLANDKDFLATQVAYKLNLTGPAVSVQTACSTSLVAVHLACQSLLNLESDMALAGGVTIHTKKQGYMYMEGSIASPDGHCRAFDAKAQGTVGGSGVGIVLLKRLADALEDGDRVLAVIKGSAINNDGGLKAGFTAPSLEGQAEVVRDALTVADIDPESISYIETHGTGTILGDPIEIAALTRAFQDATEKTGFCKIGAVKSHVGHLDAAAGVTGLIKSVLALQHQLLPPTLHFETPNPKIDFANSPFVVNAALSKWERNGHPLRAGVSSFGIGGTNAHVILEEAPVVPASDPTFRPWQLLLLSARTATALETMTSNLREHLRENPEQNLADVAYTLQVGRQHFDHSRLLVCQDVDQAVALLESRPPDQVLTTHQEAQSRSVVFMFSGQGSQYPNMGLELYQYEALFRDTVDECAEILKPHLGLDLRDVIYPTALTPREIAAQRLTQTALAQPALFVTSYALAKLWMSWGVEPQAMIGHSIGEFVAACLAGVFSLEDALRLVAIRGRLMQAAPFGDMLAVPLSADEVEPFLSSKLILPSSGHALARKGLSLAVINGPKLCVISGPKHDIAGLERRLGQEGIQGKRLHTSHAFHSAMMVPALQPFMAAFAGVTLNPPQMPYLSNLTGTWVTAAEATNPTYWVNHLRQTVNFSAGLDELLKKPEWILLEVGPGTTLRSLAQQHSAREVSQPVLASLPHVKDQRPAMPFLLQTLGQLWQHGIAVDWSGFYANEQRQRVELPTYPFERQRYWTRGQSFSSAPKESGKLPLNKWFSVPSWKRAPIAPYDAQRGQIELSQEAVWLFFVDECAVGTQLVERLEAKGQTMITVRVGHEFSQQDDFTYTLNPSQKKEVQALFKALRKAEQQPNKIVHLWNVTKACPGPEFAKEGRVSSARPNPSFYGLLFLAQVLGEQGLSDALQLTVISNQLHSITGEESLLPEKGTLLGPCRVIPQEYPHISCRSVDVVLPPAGHNQRLLNNLLSELTSDINDSIVAYRGRHRWVQTFESVELASASHSPLREQGVYLITNGLSDTGLVMAHYLAQRVQAKLVLTHPAPLPLSSLSSSKMAPPLPLSLGADVLLVEAEVTEPSQMEAALEQTTQRFGALHGVIHIPTTRGSGLIQLKTPEQADDVLTARITGTQVLGQVLQMRENIPLDFLALFGGINAVAGGLGQVDESAANAFLDVYAHASPSGIVSIDWSGWHWDHHFEELAAGAPQMLAEVTQLREMFGIKAEEAGPAFERILASRQPQLIVSTQDLQRFIEQQNALTATNFMDEMGGAARTVSDGDPSYVRASFVAPANEVEQTIAAVWQDVFGVERVGRFDNFFDLGGHSLLAIQLVSRMRDALKMEDFPLSSLFESPTVAGLAEIAASQQEEELSDEIEALLMEIEGLSAEELETALLAEMDF